MDLLFFCPFWGMENLPVTEAFEKIKAGGYDGVEIALDPSRHHLKEISTIARGSGLLLLAQHPFAQGPDLSSVLQDYKDKLSKIVQVDPFMVNCHSGRDYFDFEENLLFLKVADALAKDSGIRIAHETHRGRFSYSAPLTEIYLEKLPWLPLVADFSHWCVVSESLLQQQQARLDRVINNCIHIHARVGSPQSPQVMNPAHPIYHQELKAHMGWWQQLADKHRLKGERYLSITCEFGPPPYMPITPYSTEDVPTQWETNLFMKEYLKTHLKR